MNQDFSNSTHLFDILRRYREADEGENWLAATLVSKHRSSYRLPGAMMLINPLGQSFGLISGGCLEANIREQARRVQAVKHALCPVYDTTDEDSIAAELGLGCNGRVEVLIQELSEGCRAVLLQLLDRMENGASSYLLHCFSSGHQHELGQIALLDEKHNLLIAESNTELPDISKLPSARHQIVEDSGRRWSLNRHLAPLRLCVIGGGVDARPMVEIASKLGWQVTLVDHRISHARPQDFQGASRIVRQSPLELTEPLAFDAAVIMSHNLGLDAQWLQKLQHCETLRYLGLLGPVDRKHEVLRLADISPQSDFCERIYGPMGLDMGGDTPESVALSTLAQCHQVVFSHELGRH